MQYMLDKPLKDMKNFKDLGVTISEDLSWDNHIGITVNKANNLISGTTNVNVFSMLYLSLVRPILEYSVSIVCPYLVKDIHALVYKEGHLGEHLNNTKEKCLMSLVVNCWDGHRYLTVEIIYL